MRVAEYVTVACLTAAIARDIVRLFRGRPFVQDVAHSLLHTNCMEDGDGVFARWAHASTGRRRTPPRPQPAGQAFTAGHCPRVAGGWEIKPGTPTAVTDPSSLDCLNTRNDVQKFLTALRARITPEMAGLTVFGGERRVPGLRRKEVAQLAGVSTAYYTRMERGDLSGVSESVLFALVRALQLNEAETAHLFDLRRAATGPRRAPWTKPQPRVSPRVTQLIEAMIDVSAIAMTRLGDPVASHPLGRALFPDLFPAGKPALNSARYMFLDERSRTFYPDWETTALEAVSGTRLFAGQDPSDRALMALVVSSRPAAMSSARGGAAIRHPSGLTPPSGNRMPPLSAGNYSLDATELDLSYVECMVLGRSLVIRGSRVTGKTRSPTWWPHFLLAPPGRLDWSVTSDWGDDERWKL